jgi:hypothetical protein
VYSLLASIFSSSPSDSPTAPSASKLTPGRFPHRRPTKPRQTQTTKSRLPPSPNIVSSCSGIRENSGWLRVASLGGNPTPPGTRLAVLVIDSNRRGDRAGWDLRMSARFHLSLTNTMGVLCVALAVGWAAFLWRPGLRDTHHRPASNTHPSAPFTAATTTHPSHPIRAYRSPVHHIPNIPGPISQS